MESDSQTTPVLAKQPSGIRALPSTDDDSDSDPLFDSSISPQSDAKGSNLIATSNETSSFSVSNSNSNDNNIGGSDEIVDNNDNDKETLKKPVAKVSAEEEDNDDNMVGGEEEDEGEDETVVSPPRVRVSAVEDDDKEDDEKEDVGGGKDDVGDEKEVLNEPKMEENGVVEDSKQEEEEKGGVFEEEEDAVVETISVDVGEAVRSGAAVVGVQNEVGSTEEESLVENDGPGIDGVKGTDNEGEDKVEEDDGKEPKVEENGVVEDSKEEKDAVVESINVDVGEAVRSWAAVVGVQNEVGPAEEVEKDEDKVDKVEGSVGGDVGGVGDEETGDDVVDKVAEKEGLEDVKSDDVVDKVVENSVGEESGGVDSEGKGEEEEDSVVDAIKVDPVEAVRSGVAVVGEEEVKETEDVEEVEEVPVVAESVVVGNEFEPLAGSNSSELSAELDNGVAEEPKITEPEPKEPEISHSEPKDPEPESEEPKITHSEPKEPEITHSEPKDPEPESEEPKITHSEPKKPEITYSEPKDPEPEPEEPKITHSEPKDPEPELEPEPKESGEDEKEDHLDDDVDIETSRDAYTSRMVEELERASRGIDGEVVTESEEEEEEAGGSDEEEEGEGEEKELFDSAALAALLKAATSAGAAGTDPGTITITSPDGSRLFSVERPAGLGSSLRAVRPSSVARSGNPSFLTPPTLAGSSEENLSEEEKKKLKCIHDLRVKFLRLVHRLGHSAEDSVAAQVLYRLALLAGRPTSPAYSLESAKQTATQLEEEGKDDLDFSINILVLGKTGVGKSATVNSIFGEEKVKINTFDPETTTVQVVNGVVNGVKIRVIDAPGLRCSGIEQGFNRKVLSSVKKYTKKYPPDVVLYVDRLDSPARSLNDLPMLKTITASLGSPIWRSAVVALTHASCAPPEGPSGSPLSYDVFVAQRSHIVQQSIGHATGDMRLMNPSLMNPVTLVENHPLCRKNRDGQKVLPNGQTWRPQLLLLCYSLKILSEANSISKPQDPFDHRKLFGFRSRAPPLPYLLSSLLQPRVHPKLPADQGGDNVDSDIDLDDLSDSDQEEEEDEYDQLPPFRPLRKSQLAKLSKEQKRAYFEEYDYRVKLLQKKQWKEELRRMRDMKKRGGKAVVDEYGGEEYEGEDGGAPAAVPVPLPDMVLPPTFDGDNPAYRYRFLEPTSQFLARPVLDTHGWDHDCGYDGVNVEQSLGIVGKFPGTISVQVTKDKKDFNIHMDSALSAKHGDTGSSLVGFDIQTIGKQLAYIVRGETKHKTAKRNKTAGGVSVTFLGENVATGVKLEDQVSVGRRLVLVGSAGTVRSQKDAAYGANLEVRLREADYPIGQDQSSVVLSLMKWRGDLALGANLQSQFSLGRGSKMAVRVGLNNKLSGQISVRTSSSDHLQLALAGLIPIALSIYRNLKPSASENYSLY